MKKLFVASFIAILWGPTSFAQQIVAPGNIDELVDLNQIHNNTDMRCAIMHQASAKSFSSVITIEDSAARSSHIKFHIFAIKLRNARLDAYIEDMGLSGNAREMLLDEVYAGVVRLEALVTLSNLSHYLEQSASCTDM